MRRFGLAVGDGHQPAARHLGQYTAVLGRQRERCRSRMQRVVRENKGGAGVGPPGQRHRPVKRCRFARTRRCLFGLGIVLAEHRSLSISAAQAKVVGSSGQ